MASLTSSGPAAGCESNAPGRIRWQGRSTAEAALPPLIVICGATATGKTDLSLRLAETIPRAEIVSADSRQVYRGMDIGTAKVSTADRERVTHHGLDLVDPDQRFSAAQYRRAALEALHAIAVRGGVALLVGGTGLYLRAVGRGVALEETGSDAISRAELEERLTSDGLPPLVAELWRLAPTVAAVTDLANPRRVVRTLERVRLHGDVLPPPPRGYPAPNAWLGLTADPAVHGRWIERRARGQFEGGLLEEATWLRRTYDPMLPAFSAFGYREAFAVLDGALSQEEALERAVSRTRRFARRQRTWFRAESGIQWLDATRDPIPVAREKLASVLAT